MLTIKSLICKIQVPVLFFILLSQNSYTAEITQNTDRVLMVSPDHFGFNAETAESNPFQSNDSPENDTRKQALKESSKMVADLNSAGVNTIVLPSRKDVSTPDAVFPNNWFSTHKMTDGRHILVLYPMLAPNRRAERQVELLKNSLKSNGVEITETVDLSKWEDKGKYLEGTGSLVLDRVNGIAFAVLSPRTAPEVLSDFEDKLGYKSVRFHSVDKNNQAVYHTNVVMSVAAEFAVVCLESIKDLSERDTLTKTLNELGKEIVPISLEQMYNMCGNVIELNTNKGSKLLLMSQTAFNNFSPEQKAVFSKYCDILPVKIDTIEKVGGGSARCMVGEVF